MNQQANKITNDIKQLTKSLDSIVQSVSGLAENAFKDVSPEAAAKYAETLKSMDLEGQMKKAKEGINDLMKTFKE